MSEKSSVRCETPRCIETIAKYGENYHMVYVREFEGRPSDECEYCGSARRDGKWASRCRQCGADVPAGQLVGLFVPHSCSACLEKERSAQIQRGAVCRGCKQAFCDCCC